VVKSGGSVKGVEEEAKGGEVSPYFTRTRQQRAHEEAGRGRHVKALFDDRDAFQTPTFFQTRGASRSQQQQQEQQEQQQQQQPGEELQSGRKARGGRGGTGFNKNVKRWTRCC
jgi:hypothetical protein